METAVIVSLISLFGSLCGTFAGIFASTKLTIYRIEQLEKKMDRFVAIEQKLYELEKHNAIQDERTEYLTKEVAKAV